MQRGRCAPLHSRSLWYAKRCSGSASNTGAAAPAASVGAASFLPTRGLLRVASASAAAALLVISGAILSWPVLDNWIMPYAYQVAIDASTSRRRQTLLPPQYDDASEMRPHTTAVDDIRGVLGPPPESSLASSTRGAVVLVSGPPGCGKSSRIEAALDGRPFVYINCRGFVEGSEVLYGALSTMIVKPLGPLGGLIVAYNKLFNAIADVLTMNQHHTHVSHIMFAQNLQYLRAAMSTQNPARRPVVVVDQFEQLVELLDIHGRGAELSVFPLLLTKILLRSALDEGLCDVLLVCDGKVLRREAPSMGATTPLARLLPDLAARCQYHFVSWPTGEAQPNRTCEAARANTTTSRTAALIRQDGVAPGIMGVCLRALASPSQCCVPEAIANAWQLPVNDVILACERLVDVGAMVAAFGATAAPGGLTPHDGTAAQRAAIPTWFDDAAAGVMRQGATPAMDQRHPLPPDSSHWYARGPSLSDSDVYDLLQGTCSELRVCGEASPTPNTRQRAGDGASVEHIVRERVPMQRMVPLKTLLHHPHHDTSCFWWPRMRRMWRWCNPDGPVDGLPATDPLVLSQVLQLKHGTMTPACRPHYHW